MIGKNGCYVFENRKLTIKKMKKDKIQKIKKSPNKSDFK